MLFWLLTISGIFLVGFALVIRNAEADDKRRPKTRGRNDNY